MTQDMVLNKKYSKITVLLLLLLMVAGNVLAQGGVVIGGSVYGGGNLADVKVNTTVNMGGGRVEGNVYGGGNLADVGTINKEAPNMNYKWTNQTGELGDNYTYNNTGVCTVSITNGTVGRVEGNQDANHGNVFGAGKGLENTYECEKAMVYKATVIIGNGTVKRNVYGGGRVGRVENDTQVTIGLGEESDGSTEYYEKQTGGGGIVTYNKVTVAAGQSVVGKYVRSGVEGSYVYTLIEANAHPVVEDNVFGAGAGVETHGYSALVRGDAIVTVQGNASVKKNVYGGGEIATVGRYWVSAIAEDPDDHAPSTMPPGMPYKTKGGGACTVNVLGNAIIGPDGAASETAGHVFGAGQGITPSYYLGNVEVLTDTASMPKRMMRYSATSYKEVDHKKTWEYYGGGTEFVWEYFNTREKYFNFLQSLALATGTHVTVNGDASVNSVKGSVYGGSESGFVQDNTDVKIQGGVIGTTGSYGNVFGGGKGLPTFSEAGKVKGNTGMAISGGTIHGTVYGGGELGDVGTITKTDIRNYTWKANTGKCEVEITGTSVEVKGNVFGAGKGETDTFWCEKAMADNTSVSITNGTVWLNVYGGGEKGRVEQDTEVTIGPETGTCTLDIKGSVFGAGKGVVTHGYSALVRGNTTVTVQSNAVVEKSIYGGGEIASVGKYGLDAKGMPSELKGGGDCVVTVLGAAQIGTNGGGNVFGAGKGETPAWVYNSGDRSGWSKRMMTHNSSYKLANKGTKWDYSDATEKYVWEYFPKKELYSKYLETLALATNPTVTINGTIDGTGSTYTVNGSVYGGGEVGITKGAVVVNINGGTIAKDVYGGGEKADTNTGNWSPNKNFVLATVQTGESVTGYFTKGDTYTLITDDVAVAQDGIDYYSYNPSSDNYVKVTGLIVGTSPVTGYYTKSDVYTQITDDDKVAEAGTDYYETEGGWTDASGTAWKRTTVNLLGGYIKGDAYGGGLGEKDGFNDKTEDIPAVVWGDIAVTLDGTKFDINYDTTTDPERDNEGNIVQDNSGNTVYVKVVKSGRVFGCNNLLGSPQGDVTVTVNQTVEGNTPRTEYVEEIVNEELQVKIDKRKSEDDKDHTYELAAVYGGGNLAPFTATGKKAYVIINGCRNTSIQTVYGGGNAAPVPETDVDVFGCFEIGSVFGGGNGKDKYKNDAGWQINPGANVGTKEQPGNANTMIYGGTVHEAFGGSNEKGTIYGDVTIDVATVPTTDPSYCKLDVGKIVGAGKNADVNGNLKIIMGCKPYEKIPLVFGGADNANVNGDVELTVTSGNFGNIVGGNNNGGCIRGHIILNIEETTCIPLNIDHLYLCGYNAAYSQYGYYVKTKSNNPNDNLIGASGETPDLNPTNGKLQLIPRESANDPHLPVKSYSYTESGVTWTVFPIVGENKFGGYASPVLNVISCTSIGEVFGGGYGATATVYGNPTVNINMIPGNHADEIDRDGDDEADKNANALGAIHDVYGGGDAAAVYGNTTVNIGTAKKVDVYKFTYDDVIKKYELQYEEDGVTPSMIQDIDVAGAYITGNVYGGGKLADVGKYHEVDDPVWTGSKYIVVDETGNTNVNICAKYNTESGKWESVAEGSAGVTILGNVYGGGKGTNTTDASDVGFYCEKAMVLGNKEDSNGGTFVRIGNGTVGTVVVTTNEETGETVSTLRGGYVYGGGEISRVDHNTSVTIGFGEGVAGTPTTNKPVIMGTVFGAGAGLRTHGYSALVRGHSSVTIEGNAKVMQSVYGGGELATVGRYYVVDGVARNNISGGESTVTIGGYAEIGPNDMVMNNTTTGKPDDYGHVFGAGKGTQPFEGFEDTEEPWSKLPNSVATYTKFSDLVGNAKLPEAYVKYLRTLALTTETNVTIKDHAFVKGCVFGGSENGFVQENTHVTIQDNCQIGNGYVQMNDDGVYLNKLDTPENPMSVNRRYTDEEWRLGKLIPDETKEPDLYTLVHEKYYTSSLPECASWPYGQAATAADKYAPYDPNYGTPGYDSKGGRTTADDGHTFYGSVFGGGSGYYPYKPGRWFVDAGAVYGDATVVITGGHILTSVYGGNELTNVGKYQLDSDGKPTTTVTSGGKCTITMSGGTVGVPRTLKQIGAHPVTCYLFGAGKGDQRVLFNKSTNVGDVEVNIKGGTIYGSVFGGGEDGHVLRDVTMTIENATVIVPAENEGEDPTTTTITPTIGTWGTSYVDGNVFGGGRGFAGDAYTAGNVAGSIKMEIKGGNILGSIYGGGRLGSVGYGLFESTNTTNYGVMQDDNKDDEGETTNYYKNGLVKLGRGHIDITISGGTIGNDREYKLPDTTPSTGNAPSTLENTDYKTWTSEQWTAWKEHNNIPKTEFDTSNGRLTHTKGGNVFAGGMGNFYKQDGSTYISDVNWWQLGCAKSTKLTITGGTIKSNVYGGGELGQVVGHHDVIDSEGHTVYTDENNTTAKVTGTEITIQGSSTTIGTPIDDGSTVQYTFGSVFGSGYGSLDESITVNGVTSYPKYIAGLVKEDTKIDMQGGAVKASIYGGGEMASVGESTTSGETTTVTGSTHVIVSGGTIGIAPTGSGNNIKYYGGAKMGNVYGGGSGHGNTVRSGRILKNTNVTISGGTVYHNVYGGGAYGTVGDFKYTEDTNNYNKVIGVERLLTSGTGVATVTITGGTIGYDGKENGMVFGSSRGDINAPGKRDDHAAWVYDTHVTIGTSAKGTPGQQDYVAESGPQINGTVYGSGENGHVFNNTVVTINGGTIGIASGFPITTNDNGTPDDPSDDTKLSGAEYPYRGNVYGGGCGTDMYYSSDVPSGHTYNDGGGDMYNSLAGIVYGNATVNITGGRVVRNVYGAGAMGSVGKITTTEGVTTIPSGGLTTINISGGIVGVDGNNGDGNVFGAARGNATTTQTDVALVKNTSVNISANAKIKGSVYGGGETGDVLGNTEVNVCAEKQTGETGVTYVVASGNPTIGGNVYGGGEGAANSFTCWKAMVGVEGDGVTGSGTTESPYDLQDGGTTVRIYNGKVGTLEGEEGSQTLKENTGNVYGGGKIARVERNTSVEIGAATGATAPLIYGNVFAAGAGKETHGYSALVRGTSTVTVQGSAQVWKNVFGGGEKASVGRYKVKISDGNPADAPADLPSGMPYGLKAGGTCSVIIRGSATIGTDNDSSTGHIYGAGQGVDPKDYDYAVGVDGVDGYKIDEHKPGRMIGNNTMEYFGDRASYLQFIETLAISAATDVTIGGGTVKGSVFGGSESGFVYHNTDVKIQGGTVNGDAFGGGRGLKSFAEAGRVGWNTNLAVSGGTVKGNVYGGGNLGDVGTINKSDQTNYNYVWKNTDSNGNNMDPDNNNTAENNSITGTNKNTGICTVTISGGMIGVDNPADATKQGNVFGASHGSDKTYWCEKATVFATNVTITDGIVKGNVYGGGEIGRVEDDTKVTIGTGLTGDESGNDNHPTITGNVFGAGAGEETHGYSALVRGNCITTVQGTAKVEKNVYGGGEKATAGKYWISKFVPEPGNPAPEGMPDGMPYKTRGGGKCYVTVKDNAQIGPNGGATEFDGHLFGAGKGVTPAYYYDPANTGTKENWSKRMTTYNASTHVSGEGTTWDYYPEDSRFVWEYFTTEAKYLEFLQTLALATETHVTVQGNATVMGTVYGGSDSGFVQDDTEVNILGQSKIGKDDAHSYSNIFGGGKGHETFHEAGMVKGNTTVNAFGGEIYGSVYGGGAKSKVVGSTNVNIGQPAE